MNYLTQCCRIFFFNSLFFLVHHEVRESIVRLFVQKKLRGSVVQFIDFLWFKNVNITKILIKTLRKSGESYVQTLRKYRAFF